MDIDRITGAVTGGVVAGLALSAVMLAGEKLTGKPSELIELERKATAKLGISTLAGDATGHEQLITHGGHLALSALAGLAYAVIVDEKANGVKSGAVPRSASPSSLPHTGLPARFSALPRLRGASHRCPRFSTRWFTRFSEFAPRCLRGTFEALGAKRPLRDVAASGPLAGRSASSQ